MEDLIDEFVSKRVWAVVGASEDPTKYGHMVFLSLLDSGYTIYAVNPKGGNIGDETVYASLAELPEKPDVVDIVVPPQAAEDVICDCAKLGITRIWLQPGAESDKAISLAKEMGLKVVHHACAMDNKVEW